MNRPALHRAVLALVLAASGALLRPSAAAAQGTPADHARVQNFDLLVVPGANHPAGRGNDPTAPYGDHKRFDFFVQHLLGVTPPNWNRTSTTPTDQVPR